MLPVRIKQVVITMLATVGTIATAYITTLTATNLNSTTIQATTVHSTSVSSTSLTVGQGSAVDLIRRGTVTVNPSPIAPGQSTSTLAITMTGVTAGDHCSAVVSAGDLGGTTSSARLLAIAGSGTVTVSIQNTSGTGAAYDAGSSVISALCHSF